MGHTKDVKREHQVRFHDIVHWVLYSFKLLGLSSPIPRSRVITWRFASIDRDGASVPGQYSPGVSVQWSAEGSIVSVVTVSRVEYLLSAQVEMLRFERVALWGRREAGRKSMENLR